MSITVLEPGADVLTLEEVKDHLRVDHDDDDLRIIGLIAAVAEHHSLKLDKALTVQTLLWTADEGFRCSTRFLWLPFPPVREIVAVRYDDDGVATPYDPTTYTVHNLASDHRAWIQMSGSIAAQLVTEVEFIAGYDTVPPSIAQSMKMLISRLYAQTGEMTPTTLAEDRAIYDLMSPFRPMIV